LQRFVKAEAPLENKAKAYNALGIAFKRTGQTEAALQAFKSAVELKPDYAEALYNIAIIKNEEGDETSAIPLFIKSSEIGTNDTYSLEYLAEIYLKNKDYEAARGVLVKAKERQPYSAEILCRLAIVELEAGNINKSLINLQESLEQNSKYAPSIFNMALITHHRLKNYDQARAYYKAFLKLESEGGYAEVARKALLELESQKKSEKTQKIAAQKASEKPVAPATQEEASTPDEFMQIARLAEKQKKIDLAVQNYIRVAEAADKKNETSLQHQALLKAAELCGKDPDLNFVVGNYYFTRSLFKEAIPFLKEAITGRPKWYEAQLALGKAAAENTEYDAAALALKQADSLKPQNGDALWQLAVLYDHSLNIKSKAINLYGNFIERFPDDYRVPEAGKRIDELKNIEKTASQKPEGKTASRPSGATNGSWLYKLFH
jgi:tetratricopeptide (TPR) repeat protein